MSLFMVQSARRGCRRNRAEGPAAVPAGDVFQEASDAAFLVRDLRHLPHQGRLDMVKASRGDTILDNRSSVFLSQPVLLRERNPMNTGPAAYMLRSAFTYERAQ